MHVFRQCNNWIIYLSGNITTIHYYNINSNNQCTDRTSSKIVTSGRSHTGGPMDRLHNCKIWEKNLNRKIHYHNIKEHLKLSKIAKFDCEML